MQLFATLSVNSIAVLRLILCPTEINTGFTLSLVTSTAPIISTTLILSFLAVVLEAYCRQQSFHFFVFFIESDLGFITSSDIIFSFLSMIVYIQQYN